MTFLIDRTFREPLLGGSVAGRQGDRRGPPSVGTVNEASKHPSVTLKGFLFGETKTLSFLLVVVSFPFLCSCFVRCLVWCRRFWVRFVSFTSVRLLRTVLLCPRLRCSKLAAPSPPPTTMSRTITTTITTRQTAGDFSHNFPRPSHQNPTRFKAFSAFQSFDACWHSTRSKQTVRELEICQLSKFQLHRTLVFINLRGNNETCENGQHVDV